jgi:hypothetical protein
MSDSPCDTDSVTLCAEDENQQTATTTTMEPDQSFNVPIEQLELESIETLLFFGLHRQRAEQIWQKWKSFDNDDEDDPYSDFGIFTRVYLRNLVHYESCDTDEEDEDWRPKLRQIGANEQLVDAISGQGPDYDGVRPAKSAAEWVYQAIDWRWEWLLFTRYGRSRGE